MRNGAQDSLLSAWISSFSHRVSGLFRSRPKNTPATAPATRDFAITLIDAEYELETLVIDVAVAARFDPGSEENLISRTWLLEIVGQQSQGILALDMSTVLHWRFQGAIKTFKSVHRVTDSDLVSTILFHRNRCENTPSEWSPLEEELHAMAEGRLSPAQPKSPTWPALHGALRPSLRRWSLPTAKAKARQAKRLSSQSATSSSRRAELQLAGLTEEFEPLFVPLPGVLYLLQDWAANAPARAVSQRSRLAAGDMERPDSAGAGSSGPSRPPKCKANDNNKAHGARLRTALSPLSESSASEATSDRPPATSPDVADVADVTTREAYKEVVLDFAVHSMGESTVNSSRRDPKTPSSTLTDPTAEDGMQDFSGEGQAATAGNGYGVSATQTSDATQGKPGRSQQRSMGSQLSTWIARSKLPQGGTDEGSRRRSRLAARVSKWLEQPTSSEPNSTTVSSQENPKPLPSSRSHLPSTEAGGGPHTSPTSPITTEAVAVASGHEPQPRHGAIRVDLQYVPMVPALGGIPLADIPWTDDYWHWDPTVKKKYHIEVNPDGSETRVYAPTLYS